MSEQPRFDAPSADWLVFADTLQQAGDVRGELFALNAGDKVGERDQYLEKNFEALFGKVPANAIAVNWNIFADSVDLRVGPKDNGLEWTRAFLGSPIAKSMRRFRLVGITPNPRDTVELGDALAHLGDHLPPSCEALELIDDRAEKAEAMVASDYTPDRNLVRFGPLTPVWKTNIQSLDLHIADPEQIDFGEISSQSLRHFGLFGLCWPESWGEDRLVDPLASASWPNLESLELRLPDTFTCSYPSNDGAYIPCERYEDADWDDDGDSNYLDWGNEIGSLVDSLRSSKLKRLALHSFENGGSVVRMLANPVLPDSIEVLDFSESEFCDDDAEWMVEHRRRFANLKKLDLTETRVTPKAAESLKKLGAEVTHSSGGAIYRFRVGME